MGEELEYQLSALEDFVTYVKVAHHIAVCTGGRAVLSVAHGAVDHNAVVEQLGRYGHVKYVRASVVLLVAEAEVQRNLQFLEYIVELPEISSGTLIRQGFEKPGYVYGVGRSVSDILGIYRLENKLVNGSGSFKFKNVEGLAKSPKSVRDSLNAAFNYFREQAGRIVTGSYEDFDYSLYFNDLQSRGVSDEISVAEVVGLFSGLANRAVLPALIICGRVVMSGSMMPITTDLDEIFVASANAGAKTIMLPAESKNEYDKLRTDLKDEISVIFYSTPLEAAKKALGVE